MSVIRPSGFVALPSLVVLRDRTAEQAQQFLILIFGGYSSFAFFHCVSRVWVWGVGGLRADGPGGEMPST